MDSLSRHAILHCHHPCRVADVTNPMQRESLYRCTEDEQRNALIIVVCGLTPQKTASSKVRQGKRAGQGGLNKCWTERTNNKQSLDACQISKEPSEDGEHRKRRSVSPSTIVGLPINPWSTTDTSPKETSRQPSAQPALCSPPISVFAP